MKLSLIFFVALLCLIVDARRKKHKSDDATDKELLKVFGSPVKSKSSGTLNCFSLTEGLAAAIESFLTAEANGTKALKVKFHLTTRSNPERVTLRKGKKFSLDNVDFNVTKKTAIVVHGFMSSGDANWTKKMADAFLKWDDMNVIVVDWSDGANTYNYPKAAMNTKTVGDQIATFFAQVIEAKSASTPDDSWGALHFVGHSLGAHIVGYTAREMRKRNLKWQVQRITGLDPAQPCFSDAPSDRRLDRTAAPFVDVIHTNAKDLRKFGLGSFQYIGHLDFYPNGGENQPKCIKFSENPLLRFIEQYISDSWNIKKMIEKMICSHGMAYRYFTDSLKRATEYGCVLLSFKWDRTWASLPSSLNPLTVCGGEECVEMGIMADTFKDKCNGTYFTITGKSSPYCKFDDDSKEKLEALVKIHKDNDYSSE